MRTAIRKAGVACGTVFASAALAVTTATGAWGANSALVVGGLDTPSMHDLVMQQLLGGALTTQPRVSVNWPAEAAPYTGAGDLSLGDSINVGITNLDSQIDAALARLAAPGEKVTVVGLSAGSLVVNEILRQLAADANAPGKDQLTFVVVADSSRQKVIDKAKYNSQYDYTYQPAPETKYDVTVVTGEFDGASDFPDRWWNFVALANAIAGTIVVHVPVMFADLSEVPTTNISVDVNSLGGVTTHYLVPTETLPLVQLLPFLKSQEASLRAQVEKGYSRYDNKPSAAQTLAAAPTVVDEVEDTVVPVAKTTVAAAVAEPAVEATEAVSTKNDQPDAPEADAAVADAAEADAAVAEADAAEADAAEAAEVDAAEAEAEADAAEAAEAEADAAEADTAAAEVTEANDAEGTSVSGSSDDSSSSASGSADSE